jgi:hypothetical protein
MNAVFHRGGLLLLVLLLGLLLALSFGPGCGDSGPPPPPTFSVRGQVKYRDGKPFSGGAIEFRSLTNPAATTIGAIDSEGRFTLHTLAGSRKVAGAQEGVHRVVIIPQSITKKIKPIVLSETYQVKAGENVFEIRIDPVEGAQ